jgi:hypothetical protein
MPHSRNVTPEGRQPRATLETLIITAMTGKPHVREAAAALPEEVEPASLDEEEPTTDSELRLDDNVQDIGYAMDNVEE